jgi:hypothetical protein
MLYECFLGIEPHWALWRQIFVIRRPLHYQTGGFSCKCARTSNTSTFGIRRTILAGGRVVLRQGQALHRPRIRAR